MDTKDELIEEKAQIDARLAHLDGHFADERFIQLPGESQGRLKLQREVMLKYSEVLGERIREFNADEQTGEEKETGVKA